MAYQTASSSSATLSSPRATWTAGGVLLVCPWYRPALGGVVEVADRLLRMLNQSQVPAQLLICDRRPSTTSHELPPDLQDALHYLPIPTGQFSLPGLRSRLQAKLLGMLAMRHLRQLVRRHSIRTVIILYPLDHAWLLLPLCRQEHLRLIVSCHGNDLTHAGERTTFSRELLKSVLQSADAVTVCGEHLASHATRLMSDSSAPVAHIPNCVDTTHFRPGPSDYRRSRVPTLVHVSNFAKKKKTCDILHAFAIADIPEDSRLIMVGFGPEYARTIEKAHNLDIVERVDFVGTAADVRQYLWQADVFVLASEDEGDPLSLLEAIACGIPYISTPWGVAARTPAGECGLVVPPCRPDLLAEAMSKLFADPDKCRAMGQRARQLALSDYTEERYLQQHLDLIAGLQLTRGASRGTSTGEQI